MLGTIPSQSHLLVVVRETPPLVWLVWYHGFLYPLDQGSPLPPKGAPYFSAIVLRKLDRGKSPGNKGRLDCAK